MSLRPTEFIKDSFRNSIKVLYITLVVLAGNEILAKNYDKALNLFWISLYVVCVLGVTYIPAFVIFLREQATAYLSFKKYSPSVKQIDDALGNMKEEYLTNLTNAIPETDLKSERERSLESTILALEKRLEGNK